MIVMIRNIYGFIMLFVRFILKLQHFLRRKEDILEKYFWSKLIAWSIISDLNNTFFKNVTNVLD